MDDWKHIAHVEGDYFSGKPSGGNSSGIFLIIALVVLALIALYYIGGSWSYPLKEFYHQILSIETEYGTTQAVVTALLSIILAIGAVIFIVFVVFGDPDSSGYFCLLICSLVFCWLCHGIASLAIYLVWV